MSAGTVFRAYPAIMPRWRFMNASFLPKQTRPSPHLIPVPSVGSVVSTTSAGSGG